MDPGSMEFLRIGPQVTSISTWNPNDLYFLKVNPTKHCLNSNPNKGQLGSRYIYLFEDELWSIYDVVKDDTELTRTVQKHLMAKQYVQKTNMVTKETALIQLTRLKLTLTWLAGTPTMNEDVPYYSNWWFSVIMLVSIGYVYIERMFFEVNIFYGLFIWQLMSQ